MCMRHRGRQVPIPGRNIAWIEEVAFAETVYVHVHVCVFGSKYVAYMYLHVHSYMHMHMYIQVQGRLSDGV